MKTLLFLILVTSLAGCYNKAEERKFSAMPKELANCRVFYVQNSDGVGMTVARCPNSTTTAEVRSGKTTQTTVTIDGVEYAPTQK